ncbi:MAG: mechanosensitive ion channel family protein [Deltaproteobacteria bacterium]|nr:mechanosensitive ion channel family protein [Deltaproteobacteria bacterium]
MSESEIFRNFLSSLILIIGIFFLSVLITKGLEKKNNQTSEDRQRWKFYLRNMRMFLIAAGLILIWAAELKALALSIVAFAVAIIVAMKELILCFLGGILQAVTKPFTIGDRIEVGCFRGDVIDQNILTTQLLEVGYKPHFSQYTGREITIPNALFLSSAVFNETAHCKYVLHSFTLNLPRQTDWRKTEKALLKKASELISPYKNYAEKALRQYSTRKSLDLPGLEPRVFISLSDSGSIHLMVRLPVPSKDKGKIEQQLIRALDADSV